MKVLGWERLEDVRPAGVLEQPVRVLGLGPRAEGCRLLELLCHRVQVAQVRILCTQGRDLLLRLQRGIGLLTALQAR